MDQVDSFATFAQCGCVFGSVTFGSFEFFLFRKKENTWISKKRNSFLFCSDFRAIPRKKTLFPQFREKCPIFFSWIGKKFRFRSDFYHVSFWFLPCLILTFRPMQFQVHSMFFCKYIRFYFVHLQTLPV